MLTVHVDDIGIAGSQTTIENFRKECIWATKTARRPKISREAYLHGKRNLVQAIEEKWECEAQYLGGPVVKRQKTFAEM